MNGLVIFALECVAAGFLLLTNRQYNNMVADHPEIKGKYNEHYIATAAVVAIAGLLFVFDTNNYCFFLVPVTIVSQIYNYILKKEIERNNKD